MFNLPPGNAVDSETDLSVGQNQMPFETGVISHYKPRAKTACAHRLVHGGRVVGWLSESEAKQTFVTGDACLLYTSPSPRDRTRSRMPSSA